MAVSVILIALKIVTFMQRDIRKLQLLPAKPNDQTLAA